MLQLYFKVKSVRDRSIFNCTVDYILTYALQAHAMSLLNWNTEWHGPLVFQIFNSSCSFILVTSCISCKKMRLKTY
jgi:hypothetical protein